MRGDSLGYRLLKKLPKRDLDFIITTVARRRNDYDEIRRLVAGKPDLIDIMLDDEGLFERVTSDQEILLKITPYLLFTILVRKAKRDLEHTSYTMEPVGTSQRRLPVFDAGDASHLLEDVNIRDYLAELLASFTRVNSTTVYLRGRGGHYYKKTYSELNPDDMKELAGLVSEEYRFALLKRIGDICLFLTGIFPDFVTSFGHKRGIRRDPGTLLAEYEKTGMDFYNQAASLEDAHKLGLSEVLKSLAEDFTLARKPLNVISDKYIYAQRTMFFGNPA